MNRTVQADGTIDPKWTALASTNAAILPYVRNPLRALALNAIDPFPGAPVGAAMFDYVVTLPLLASAAAVASVFTICKRVTPVRRSKLPFRRIS